MRVLYQKSMDLFYGCLLAEPQMLMPVVYTPTVGEACQKFGIMPFYSRGCYVSITQRGNIRAVLEEYAQAELDRNDDGTYGCDCIVFSDGGRILGPVSYTHLRAHETVLDLVCRLLLEKKKKKLEKKKR
eukprot:TRINITY_DN2929_c0_g1_i1.p1 TRINITY_DN2929_c0_g1~~TRINITY_DN2929_c0_g1_i1.p1  ORF type:complete len:129 (-),score=54.13 TRINITY_DN2929_c0_g1_i1:72-458(-)